MEPSCSNLILVSSGVAVCPVSTMLLATKTQPQPWFCPSPEPVWLLPTKVVLNSKTGRLQEVVKLANEMTVDAQADELVLKIKLVGVNYTTDILPLRHHLAASKDASVVPFNKIVGKVHVVLKHPNCAGIRTHAKYLVFPHSTCNIQRVDPCEHCARLAAVRLTKDTVDLFCQYPCLRRLEYGVSIDGGLQDYLKILQPAQSLLEIPANVSLHDCCFMMEIMLPFYIFMSTFYIKYGYDQAANHILIVLNSVKNETNDVLIVLKQLNIDRKSVTLVDPDTIELMLAKERTALHKKFEFVLCFNFADVSLDFVDHCVASVGLPSSKSRFHVAWFDQYAPVSSARFKKIELEDKTFHHVRVGYHDFIHAQTLLSMISSLNILKWSAAASNLEVSSENRPSITSIDSGLMSVSSQSVHLGASSTTSLSLHKNPEAFRNPKLLRFRDDDSIINSESDIRPHVSWLWYERDVDFCRGCEYDDFGTYTHNLRAINSHILGGEAGHSRRICYSNKPSKPVKLNAFVLSS